MREEWLGLDLDNVICDNREAVVKYLQKHFNLYLDMDKDLFCYEFDKNPNLTSYVAECLTEAMHNGYIFGNTLPFDDVLCGLSLLKGNNFNIHIVTSRGNYLGNGKEIRESTLEWLNKYNIIFDDISFVRTRDKADLVFKTGLKAFVEDRFDVLNMILDKCGVLEYGLVIVDKPWNEKYYHKSVNRAYNFKTACKIIVNNKKDAR